MSCLKGIDCAAKISAVAAQQIKAAGYDFVCRYLVPAAGVNAWKALTAMEAHAISDAGLLQLSVYETTADRCKGGAAAGTADGRAACQLAQAYDIPETAILYFAVDFDAQAGDLGAIEAYLRAARAQTGGYEVGVYGSFRVIEAMAQRGACKGFWQCYAWSYKQTSAHRTAYQYRNGQTVSGISVDLDEAYDGAGLWSYGQAATAAESEDEMAKIVDQLAENCKTTPDDIVIRLSVLCSLVNEKIDSCETDGIAYLKAAGLTNADHDPREPIAYGNLGLVLQRFADNLKK